ncbi:hypothetical protein NDU88_000786 [Pleurodeles waltl]|uniref:Uncharacterized protein n=1 Tax=Pleurodeles waltl TaxID=8319 RepID=A0AAV7S713_PLEWA|nr:hypothetical protein NDU88_000786 [Pleurodeles waltl]
MFLPSRWRLLVPCGVRLSPLAENWWRWAAALISASRGTALADYLRLRLRPGTAIGPARDLYKTVFENGKISIDPDYTNKGQNSRNSFLEVKAKLRAMNIRFMLLYPGRLKVLSGGRSLFFEQPEEVWRWLEMWDKAALGRPAGTTGEVNRASGVDGSDWWNREGERTAIAMDQGVWMSLPLGLRYNKMV